MLSLLKSHSDKLATPLKPAWHPDFRNSDRLPDTKVVRTSFFVNGVAITMVLAIAIYVVYKEYSLHNIQGQITDIQHQIDKDKLTSDKAVILFKKFQEEEKKLIELRNFQASRISGSDLLIQFSKGLPSRIVINSLDFSSARVLIRANVYGPPDEGIGQASNYVNTLGQQTVFLPLFESVTLTGINNDKAANRLNIEISLKFKGASKTLQK